MTHLLELVRRTPSTLPLVCAGVLLALIACGIAVARHRAVTRAARQVFRLASTARNHEARVEARKHGAALLPLLSALTADPLRPTARSPRADLLLAFLCLAPSIPLPLSLLPLLVSSDPHAAERTVSALIGFAALLPVSIVGAIIVLHVGARSARIMRSVSLGILFLRIRPVGPSSGP